jgi:hypothetical protein
MFNTFLPAGAGWGEAADDDEEDDDEPDPVDRSQPIKAAAIAMNAQHVRQAKRLRITRLLQ